MTKTVLVTGGAGYVGAHCCKALAAAGCRPVVYDNLACGHEQFVQWGPLVRPVHGSFVSVVDFPVPQEYPGKITKTSVFRAVEGFAQSRFSAVFHSIFPAYGTGNGFMRIRETIPADQRIRSEASTGKTICRQELYDLVWSEPITTITLGLLCQTLTCGNVASRLRSRSHQLGTERSTG